MLLAKNSVFLCVIEYCNYGHLKSFEGIPGVKFIEQH